MKKQLLILFASSFFIFNVNAQTVSIIGSTSPAGDWATDIDMATTDNITYTLNNVTLSTFSDPATTGLKFRLNHDWGTNWGNSNFPMGTAVLNGSNIRTVSGTYNITFNRNNGSYTFIPSGFPSIGIWGPAVDSQLGFGGADVDMATTDGIIYTLYGFNFSSGTAYFRVNDDSMNTYGSVSFPTGTAVQGGPSIQVTGGEWVVTFNRNTGAYSFTYPSIGILGTALSGFESEDIDMATANGFNYTLNNLTLNEGEIKFRKDNSWATNWGSNGFPTGTGTQGGANIPVEPGNYNVIFDRTNGYYEFTNTLSNPEFSISNVKIYPNPSNAIWNFTHTASIENIELFDISGKMIQSYHPDSNQFQLDGTVLSNGIYFAKIK